MINAPKSAGQGRTLWITLLGLFLLLSAVTTAYASGGPAFRYGAVYTRGLVYGPSNQPIYVEYDDNGGIGIGSKIGEAVGPYAHARVMSSAQYRSFLTQLERLEGEYPGLELVSKADYATSTYTSVGGDPINKPNLASTTQTAALRPPAQRLSSDPSQLILLELPINPARQPQPNSRSLLLGADGEILWDSSLVKGVSG